MRSQHVVKEMVMVAVFSLAMSAQVPVQAQTVLIDFGNDSSFRGLSTPSPDENGNYWNSVWAGAYYPDLIDINGNATAIDFGFSFDGGNDSYNGPAGPTSVPPTPAEIAATDFDPVALGDLGATNAVFDFYVSSIFEIQGLDPSKTYNLTFYGAHKFSTDDTTIYRVFSDNTYSTLVDSVTLDVQQPGSPWLHNRDTVATISNLSPQAANILYLNFQGINGNEGYLNALEITVVPEPASVALLGLGGVGLMLMRRSRV